MAATAEILVVGGGGGGSGYTQGSGVGGAGGKPTDFTKFELP